MFGIMEKHFNLKNKDGYFLFHRCRSNHGWFRSYFSTSDGVEQGAARLVQEVQDILKQYPSLEFISLIGSSLGGMYMRCLAGLLLDENEKTLLGLKPKHFISMASPHVGVQHDASALIQTLVYYSAAGQTGIELMGFDDGKLLLKLSEGRFFAALKAFEFRHAYGNISLDHRVDFCTATMLAVPAADQLRAHELAFELEHAVLPHEHRLKNAKQLSAVQIECIKRLSQLSWRIVGVQLSGWASGLIAHSALSGRWTFMTVDGEQTRDNIIETLLKV